MMKFDPTTGCFHAGPGSENKSIERLLPDNINVERRRVIIGLVSGLVASGSISLPDEADGAAPVLVILEVAVAIAVLIQFLDWAFSSDTGYDGEEQGDGILINIEGDVIIQCISCGLCYREIPFPSRIPRNTEELENVIRHGDVGGSGNEPLDGEVFEDLFEVCPVSEI